MRHRPDRRRSPGAAALRGAAFRSAALRSAALRKTGRVMPLVLTLLLALLPAFLTMGCGNVDMQMDRSWKQLIDSARDTEVVVAVVHSNPEYASWMTKALGDELAQYAIRVHVLAVDFETLLKELRAEKADDAKKAMYDLVVMEGDGYGILRDEDLLYGPFTDRLYRLELLDLNAPSYQYRDAHDNEGYFVPIGRRMLTLLYSEDIFYNRPESFDEMLDTLGTLKGKGTYADPRSTEEGEAFLLGYVAQAMDVTQYLGPERDLEAFRTEVRGVMAKLSAIQSNLLSGGSVYPTRIDDLFSEGHIYLSMSMDPMAVTAKFKAYEYPDTATAFVVPDVGTYTSIAAIPHASSNKSGAMVAISALLSPQLQASKLAIGDMTIYHAGTPIEAIEPLQTVRLHRSAVKFSAYLDCIAPDFDASLRKIVVEEWTNVVFRSQQ